MTNAARTETPQYGLGRSLALHLLPGAFTTILYLLLVPPVTRAGFPPLMALMLATLVGFVPVELGHLFLTGKRLTGRWSLRGVVLYNSRGTWQRYTLLIPAVVVLAIALYAAGSPLDRVWGRAFFSWLPSWYTYSDLSSYARFSRAALVATFSLRLVVDGLIAPLAEELYFRGYLLPRISRFGWSAPLLNCLLFSIYHFWQPYNLPSIFLLSLPMVVAAWKTSDVRVSLFSHMALNLIGAIGTMAAVLRLH